MQARVIPLALLYLKACLVEQKGFGDDDVTILKFGPGEAPPDTERGGS